MAKAQNIIRIEDHRPNFDPAHDAKVRAEQAGTDYHAYQRAMRDMENKPATSPAGMKAKMERLREFLEDAEEGRDLAGNWRIVFALCDTIEEAIDAQIA